MIAIADGALDGRRDRLSLTICERCARCDSDDPAYRDWQHWLGKMGWCGIVGYDAPRLSLDLVAVREDRAVGLRIPEERAALLGRAFTEILERIERGATHVRMPGTSVDLDAEWWRDA